MDILACYLSTQMYLNSLNPSISLLVAKALIVVNYVKFYMLKLQGANKNFLG